MPLKRYLARVKRLETQALLIWFSLTTALWAFFTLGAEVGEGDTGAFDRYLISLLRTSSNGGEAIGPAWFKDSMRDVTALGGFTFLTLMTIVVVLGLLFHRKRREGIIVAATAISAHISIEILKFLYDRPRPDSVLPPIHAYSASFPSGHTTESTAIFLTVATVIASLEAKHNTKILTYTAATFVIIAIGFSRVYLGMHWPTSVRLGAWGGMGLGGVDRPSSEAGKPKTKIALSKGINYGHADEIRISKVARGLVANVAGPSYWTAAPVRLVLIWREADMSGPDPMRH